MKKITFITSALLLSACGGGSGTGTIDNPGADVVVPEYADFLTTSLAETQDNSVELNTYVESVLGSDGEVVSESTGRRSGARKVKNRHHDTQYNSKQLDDMKNFFDKDDEYKKEFISRNRDLVKRYAKLACGCDMKDFDFDGRSDDDVFHHLKSDAFRPNEVWKKYHYRQEQLANQKLYSGSGSRDWGNGYVKITKLQNGKIANIKLYDDWYEREFNFDKGSDNKFYATPYSYAILCGAGCIIQYNTDNTNESFESIKAGLQYTLDSFVYPLTEEQRQIAQDAIDSLTSETAPIILSQTEMEGGSYTSGFFKIPNHFAVDVRAYGKQVGLQYADFGSVVGSQWLDGKRSETDNGIGYVFAGGYGIKNINKQNIQGSMNFKGQAVGHVMYHEENANGVATDDYMFVKSNANLTFQADGTEKLFMNFSDNADVNKRWYDVEYTKKGDDVSVTLSNGDRIAAENAKYKFKDTEYSGKFTQEIVDEKYNRMISCDFDSKYYGDNEKPSEATGVVNLLDQTWAKDSAEDKELFFTAAFGAKKDKR